jgi:hypothetical protein
MAQIYARSLRAHRIPKPPLPAFSRRAWRRFPGAVRVLTLWFRSVHTRP